MLLTTPSAATSVLLKRASLAATAVPPQLALVFQLSFAPAPVQMTVTPRASDGANATIPTPAAAAARHCLLRLVTMVASSCACAYVTLRDLERQPSPCIG